MTECQGKFGCVLYLFIFVCSLCKPISLHPPVILKQSINVYAQSCRVCMQALVAVLMFWCTYTAQREFSVCACVCVEVSVVSFLPHCVWWGSCRRAEGDGDDLSSGCRSCFQMLMSEPWQSGTMLNVQFLAVLVRHWHNHHLCWKVTSITTAFCWGQQNYTYVLEGPANLFIVSIFHPQLWNNRIAIVSSNVFFFFFFIYPLLLKCDLRLNFTYIFQKHLFLFWCSGDLRSADY